MLDYVRAVCAVPEISVGDPYFNTDKILEKMKEAGEVNADILVFPELAVTGYTCGDLFFQQRLLKCAAECLKKITDESRRYDFCTVVGAPLEIKGELYNCAVIVTNGKINGIVPKTFIPEYNEFYEKRWFSSAAALPVCEISAKEICPLFDENYTVPVGTDCIFNYKNEVKFGVEICEDLWSPTPPGTLLALGGAELILNLSASNETIAKREYRRELVKQQSARCYCAYVYVSAGDGESTQDLVFSGHSIIAENGGILKENEKFIESDYILVRDIDMGKVKADRIKYKSFGDSAAFCGAGKSVREFSVEGKSDELSGNGDFDCVNKRPFVPSDDKDRLARCMNIFEMQCAGLKKRLKVTGAKAVIGVSGGLDSTLALLVAANTMTELGRPVSDVIAVTMPCFGTTDRTYTNALTLMEKLGVESREINIKEACTLHCRDIGHDIDKLDVTFENVQARERTQILMDLACREGGLVVGTGDLSELALGWCTYNADHMSMYGVNSSIPKTLIKWMIGSIAQNNIFEGCSDVLRDIIDTPISPELLPPDENGNIAQETESLIGPYILHDFFLYYVLRYGYSPRKIYRLAQRAFKDDFSDEEILKWLKSFYRRFFSQQFKRSCLPDGVKVGSVCLSPRGDWRMPSDASSKAWLRELDEM
ncbi:MAG: NAD(+) synthase [Clostridiales bacterium]|nr:NAD(+) synthase [Clostridiales bacterium]